MGSLAERMILRELQEKNRIKQEEILLQNKIAKEKEHKVNVPLRLFSHIRIENEWFWKVVAYTYFACKTLGLFILIDIFIFKRPNTTLFLFIFLCCYYFNLRLNKYILKKKIKGVSK